MLICRKRSARFLSSLNINNSNNFVSNYDDLVNLVKSNSRDPLSACVIIEEDANVFYQMDSKKVFPKTGASCTCNSGGPSGAPCHIHHYKRTNNKRGDNDNKESINNHSRQQYKELPEKKSKSRQDVTKPKNIPARTSGSNVVASTSYGTAFLESVSTNFHCPSVHQQLLFGSYLRQNVFVPYSHYPAVAFQRSFSASSILDRQNSNIHYHSSADFKGKAVGGKNGSSSVLSSVRSIPVSAMRRWDLTHFGKLYYRQNKTSEPGSVFTLISYNVLAQDLLVEHPELYTENDRNALHWEIRWKNLYQEIKEKKGDILCLQEVQKSHLDKYFSKLRDLGYDMIFKQRTGIRTDGCAIYYKVDKFALIEYTTVEYRQNVSILDRDNVAIVATLAPKENLSAQFVIATTHLLYNPRRQDIRLAQTQVLMTEVERFAYRKNEEGEEYYVPVIITGDFNSLPSSAIYKFIINGRYKYEDVMLRTRYQTGKVLIPQFLYITDNCQHAELVEIRMNNSSISRDDEDQIIRLKKSEQKEEKDNRHINHHKHTFSSGMLSHNFHFGSVYRHKINNDTEGTTYQDEWITVDYIFYSGSRENNTRFKESNLKLISKYTLPTARQLQDVRIPNFELGSDHLSLIAKFKLEYKK